MAKPLILGVKGQTTGLDREAAVGPIDLTGVEIGPDFPIQPTDNMVVVRRAPHKSNIIIPDSAKDRVATAYGVIVAAGAGIINPMTATLIPNDLKVGDHVLFGEYSGSPLNHNGRKFLHMVRKDVVAVIDPNKWKPHKILIDGETTGVPSAASRIVKPRSHSQLGR